jgi:hypothetical protein
VLHVQLANTGKYSARAVIVLASDANRATSAKIVTIRTGIVAHAPAIGQAPDVDLIGWLAFSAPILQRIGSGESDLFATVESADSPLPMR